MALAIILFCGAPFWITYSTNPFKAAAAAFGSMWLFVPAVVIALIIHELLHALGWVLASGLKARVRFGFSRTAFIIFAHPTAAVSSTAYRIGALLPAFLLGVVPLVLGWATLNAALVGWGTWGLLFAVGDLMVVWAIRRVPGTIAVLDHPDKAGCVVLDEQQTWRTGQQAVLVVASEPLRFNLELQHRRGADDTAGWTLSEEAGETPEGPLSGITATEPKRSRASPRGPKRAAP